MLNIYFDTTIFIMTFCVDTFYKYINNAVIQQLIIIFENYSEDAFIKNIRISNNSIDHKSLFLLNVQFKNNLLKILFSLRKLTEKCFFMSVYYLYHIIKNMKNV